MKNRELEEYLRRSLKRPLQQEAEQSAGLEETVKLCAEMMRKQGLSQRPQEPRTGFMQFLSDMFRFEGMPVLGLHAAVLFLICLAISTVVNIPRYVPAFMPLFVLAIMPAVFKCQYYGMSEMEAATRSSGAQIILAKLILAGAADVVCLTILIVFEVSFQNTYEETGQMVLYCLVPYLVCMICMLRLIRLHKRENIETGTVFTLGSCAFWGFLAKAAPWLYEASAFGIWIVAFLFFAALYIREIYFIIMMRKEGKMYGIIA